MKKLTFREVANIFCNHNTQNNIKHQYEDKNPLYAVIVYKESNWKTNYSLESRSYKFRSDNKYFISGLGGNSLFAYSLDDTDSIRVEWYFKEWEIDYCYILE